MGSCFAILNKRIRCLSFVDFFYLLYVAFVCAFFVLPVRLHRDFYYVLLLIPFLFYFWSRKNYAIFRSRIVLVCVFYVLYMLLSTFWANGGGLENCASFARRAFNLIAFLLMTVSFFAVEKKDIGTLFRPLCWCAGLVSYAWVTKFVLSYSPGIRLGILGGRDVPTQAGNVYASMAILAYCYFFRAGDRHTMLRLLDAVAIAGMILFVICTQSRGPLLALILTLAICSILTRDKLFLWFLLLVPAGLAMVGLCGLFDPSALLARGDSFRFVIWQQSLQVAQKKPLIGYGMGGDHPQILFGQGSVAGHAHNLFLSNLLDGGVFSVFLLLLLLSLAIYWGACYFRRRGDVTFLALVIFAILSNMTDGRTLIMSPGHQWLYFWLPVSILAAYEACCKNDGCHIAGSHFAKDGVVYE